MLEIIAVRICRETVYSNMATVRCAKVRRLSPIYLDAQCTHHKLGIDFGLLLISRCVYDRALIMNRISGTVEIDT